MTSVCFRPKADVQEVLSIHMGSDLVSLRRLPVLSYLSYAKSPSTTEYLLLYVPFLFQQHKVHNPLSRNIPWNIDRPQKDDMFD